MSFPAYPKTDRQKRIVTMAADLSATFARRAAENDWEAIFPYENYQDLREAGYLTLTVPRELGGWGADILETTLAQEQLAQGDASTALVMSMHLANIARLVTSLSPDDEHLVRICSEVVNNGALINSAASEPATGSPSRGGRPTTTAFRQADGSWRINGRKTYTTGSPVLQLFLVHCGIEDEASAESDLPAIGDRGIFLVPREAEGIRVEETWNSLAMRGSGSHDLVLENVHLPANAYAESLNSISPTSQLRQGGWGLPVTAVYQGIAEAARLEALRFARQRRPNSLTQPITSLPHIQEKAARIELALLQSRAVLYGMAEQASLDPESVPTSQFAAAKYLVVNHAIEVVDLAMRLVGGASLAQNRPLQRYYRDVRAGLHHPPMDDTTISLLSKDAFAEEV